MQRRSYFYHCYGLVCAKCCTKRSATRHSYAISVQVDQFERWDRPNPAKVDLPLFLCLLNLTRSDYVSRMLLFLTLSPLFARAMSLYGRKWRTLAADTIISRQKMMMDATALMKKRPFGSTPSLVQWPHQLKKKQVQRCLLFPFSCVLLRNVLEVNKRAIVFFYSSVEYQGTDIASKEED